MAEVDANIDPAKKGSYEFSKLETYGDLKKLIQVIALKQKGKKIVSQGVELGIDQLLGLLPGASNVKTAFDFFKSAISKPDTKKTISNRKFNNFTNIFTRISIFAKLF